MSLHKVDFETVSREFPPGICTASYITMNKLLRQTPGRPCLEATVTTVQSAPSSGSLAY